MMSLVGYLVLSLAAAGPAKKLRRYDPLATTDRAELTKKLKTHVAHVQVKLPTEENVTRWGAEQSGFAVVLEPKLLAVQSFVVDKASSIRVQGPQGTLPVRVVLDDRKRRVTLLRSDQPLRSIGLVPAPTKKRSKLARDQVVFSLISTVAEATVLDGAIVDPGEMPEYEGHPRIDLKLKNGMPVFDEYAQFVGYARWVAWDVDKFMIVPIDHIQAARTATQAAARKKVAPSTDCAEAKFGQKCRPAHVPWWSKQ